MAGKAGEYDVVVVGGGPAGSTAAFLLQSAGHNVLLIEKDIHPRPKLCGGLITRKTTRLLERVYGADPGQLMEQGIIDYSSDKYEVRAKGKRVLFEKTPVPFYFVKRETFDEFLFNLAREAGVSVRQGEEVKFCDPSSGLVRTASGAEFSGRYIIGADGIHSRVRRSFPAGRIDHDDWIRNIASAFEIAVPRDALADFSDIDHPVIHTGEITGGYGWIFPNSDCVLFGTASLNDGMAGHQITVFKEFLSTLGISPEEISPRGWAIPYGTCIRDPVCHTALLAGDAGGFADPLMGEGIFYAQRTAELAAKAVGYALEGGYDAGDAYRLYLSRSIYPEIRCGRNLRRVLFSFTRGLPVSTQRLLHKAFRKPFIELVHGQRSFCGLRRCGDLHERI